MPKYANIVNMHKNAGFGIGAAIVGGLGSLRTAYDALTTTGKLYVHALLWGAALAGGSGGWALAKAQAKDEQDIKAARKAYRNEQTKADIANLYSKLSDEYNANRETNIDQGKSMRLS